MSVQRIAKEQLEEQIVYKELDIGLRVYVLPKPGYAKKFATFSTRYGSIDNKFALPDSGEVLEVPDGIAHFLEHKLFEEEYGSVFDKFAELGASANAYTTHTSTTYLFSCTDNFEANFEILLDFVQHPYFTDENVAKEKGIIEQELRMYLDTPHWRVFSNLLEALYHQHPIRIDIGGTVESIQNITKELLYKCYNVFYHPSNMVVFVVGDVEPESVFRQVESNVGKRGYIRQPEIKRVYPEEPSSVRERKVTQDMVVSIPIMYLGFKEKQLGQDGLELLKREVGTDILLELLFGKSTRAYSELYEAGLIDERFSARYTGEKDFGYTVIGGQTRDPEALYQRLQDIIRKARTDGLKKEDFSRQRKKYIGEFLRSFNSPEAIAQNFNYYYFRGVNLFEYLDVLNKITLDDVLSRLSEHLADDNYSVSIINPKS